MKPPLLLAALLLAIPVAQGQHKHVHGEGRLNAAIDKDILTLNLELPLDVAAGFERAPKSDQERAALAAAEKTLKDAATLWLPNAAAHCVLQSVQVDMPKSAGDHADIDASYAYRCAAPAALKTLETGIFKNFKRLYRLEAQRVGPAGQGALRLTPKAPVIHW